MAASNLKFLSVSLSIGKCQRGRSEAAKFSSLKIRDGFKQSPLKMVSPVFCNQKVWIRNQGLSVERFGSLSVASVEEERAKVGDQLWVGHCINCLLVHLGCSQIMKEQHGAKFAQIILQHCFYFFAIFRSNFCQKLIQPFVGICSQLSDSPIKAKVIRLN